MSDGTVTQWIDNLKDGGDRAAQELWEKYYHQLVRVARKKLGTLPKRATDEEDVVVSAFNSFCRNAADGRFPKLEDRDDLWKLLFTITERKAIAHIKHELRQKRGGGNIRGESLFDHGDNSADGRLGEAAIDQAPTPEFAAEVTEQVDTLLAALGDEMLQQLAAMKMAGDTNIEIAEKLGCSERTIKRKLQVIRTIWSEGLT